MQEIDDLIEHGDTMWLYGEDLIKRFTHWSKETGKPVIVY